MMLKTAQLCIWGVNMIFGGNSTLAALKLSAIVFLKKVSQKYFNIFAKSVVKASCKNILR